jgi:hypothetical protein
MEALEARTLLDAGTAAIIVGRTLSSATVGGIRDGQDTLT